MADPVWLDAREERVWRAFLTAGLVVDAAMEAHLASAGLSSAEYTVLALLSESAEGQLRVGELGRAVG